MHWPLQSDTPNLAHKLMKTPNGKRPNHPILLHVNWIISCLNPYFRTAPCTDKLELSHGQIRSWIHRSPLVPASNPPPLFFFSNLAPDSLGDSKQRSSWLCDKRVQNSSTIFTIVPKFAGRLGTIKLIPYIDSSVIFQCNPNTRVRLEHHAKKRI